jgi:hypothetical protein
VVSSADAQRGPKPPPTNGIVAGPTDVYSVKFLCGTFRGGAAPGQLEGPVKPGNYLTAINLHNPNGTTVFFKKKAVLLFRDDQPQAHFEEPKPPSKFIQKELASNWGMEIDCADIRLELLADPAVPPPTGFIKGWVVIEVPGPKPKPLDVTAAYTAHGLKIDSAGLVSPEGFSLQVLPITPKQKQ